MGRTIHFLERWPDAESWPEGAYHRHLLQQRANTLSKAFSAPRRRGSSLLDAGVITSSSARAPLQLVFPATLVGQWISGLFPDKIKALQEALTLQFDHLSKSLGGLA